MSAAPVRFDGVWKKFRRGERHDSLRDLIPAAARRLFRPRPADALAEQEFWALRDVSFEVAAGETLGIIGRNGAGKSTILKLLSRILRPTRGHSQVRGRVGALIELAAGFHPDLTGRENICMQGAVMGMRRGDIARKFEAIVEFADVAAFIDTPVKRYSSGMHARLGFSIAAHLEPDVLIIDEILSVGDLAFQQRCIDRMMDFRRHGAAIVFVSHNLQAVATHFDRGLLLDRGTPVFLGSAAEAVARYTERPGAAPASALQDEGRRARVVSASLRNRRGSPAADCAPDDELSLFVTYEYADERPDTLIFGFYVTDAVTGLRIYNAGARDLGLAWTPPPGHRTVTMEYRFRAHLLKGSYHVNCYVSDRTAHQCLHQVEPAAHLIVKENFSAQGIADLAVRCRVVEGAAGAPQAPADELTACAVGG